MQERVEIVLPFATPDDSVRWRIIGSRVEQSTDKGATWRDVPTGLTTPLTAGSAPSATVCWLVGADGTVLVRADAAITIDGVRMVAGGRGGGGGGRGGGGAVGQGWRRIDFPEKTELSSIVAIDALTATVKTTDGREFRTTDGGRTWQKFQL
jgi:photosystem II stability/assembly factor-like uncharacterized protein